MVIPEIPTPRNETSRRAPSGSVPPRRPGLGVATVPVTVLVCVILLAGAPVPAGAEVHSEVSLDIYNSLVYAKDISPGEDIAAGASATVQLDLKNTGSRDVRSWFQLRSTLAHREDGTAMTIVDVPRAEVRWRMTAGERYTMRYTAGRTRLTWGDGVLYNAGDVLNGVGPNHVDLTADTLRDETLWLISAYLPVGRFSFVEPVLLVPMNRLLDSGPSTDLTTAAPRPASEIGAGGRMQGQIAGIKSEVGYLYRGTSDDHRPYVTFQGNLVLDWYTGASWSSASREGFVSGGVLYNGVTNRYGNWSARTEALWGTAGDVVELFPGVTWSPSRLFSLFLRGLTSTEAETLDAAAGFTWIPSTGLSLSLYGIVNTEQEAGAITTAVSYVF
ncbi:MAG: hypothetical protein WD492_07895 [Alkalispirochaeta sp.]